MKYILWIDAIVHLFMGSQLTLRPRGFIRMLGLPPTDTTFYPRLLGAVLFGIGLSILIGIRTETPIWIGPGAEIVLALVGAGVLATLIASNRFAFTARGKVVSWFLVALLVLLAWLEYRSLG